jgi:hypothetical protein
MEAWTSSLADDDLPAWRRDGTGWILLHLAIGLVVLGVGLTLALTS